MNLIYFLLLEPRQTYSPEFKKDCSKLASKIVKKAACEVLGVKDTDLVFDIAENGKPYLKSHPQLHFNISHSNNGITVAVSDSPVGIDCEKLRKASLKTAKRYFTEKENAYISRSKTDTDCRFFEIWTKKEAFLKQEGCGLTVSLSSFDVTEKNIRTFEKDGFIISVCFENEPDDFMFIKLTENEILQEDESLM